jgi:hypothetical protein
MSDFDKPLVAGRTPSPWGMDEATPLDGDPRPKPPNWDAIHHFKNPTKRKLQVCFFWAKNTINNNAPAYVKAAQKLLGEHNLVLDVCGGDEKKPERTLPFDEMMNLSHEDTLWQQAKRLHAHEGRLPIIFCRFAGPVGASSDTNGYFEHREGCGPVAFINVDNTSIDGVTLLHELGHAAGCGHERSGKDAAFPNFMDYSPPARTGILRNQVIKLAAAAFAVDA